MSTYYWSPVKHWEISGNKIMVGNQFYPGVAELFPQFYFQAQKGIQIHEIAQHFSFFDQRRLQRFVQDLIRDQVLVTSLLSPIEIFSTQKNLFKNEYSEAILFDPIELKKFKDKQLNRSHLHVLDTRIKLQDHAEFPTYMIERQSHRLFDEEQLISFEAFSAMLSIFKQKQVDGEVKYYYPNAGGLGEIDIFIYVKDQRIENVKQGIYYYHPVGNELVLVNDSAVITDSVHYLPNKSIFNSSAFSIFFIYNAEASMPKYGPTGYFYACIDTGIMVSTLTQIAEMQQIGLCSIGEMLFKKIEGYFKLNKNQLLIHVVEGGLKLKK